MSQADEPTGWPDPEHADEPQHEADHDIATWLRSLSEEALWFEVERRLGLETAGCNPAEPDPEPDPEVEWRGKWELPEATALEAAAPVTASQVYAVVDATYVRECLLQAGLTECHSQEALDGFVVVASDVARVFTGEAPRTERRIAASGFMVSPLPGPRSPCTSRCCNTRESTYGPNWGPRRLICSCAAHCPGSGCRRATRSCNGRPTSMRGRRIPRSARRATGGWPSTPSAASSPTWGLRARCSLSSIRLTCSMHSLPVDQRPFDVWMCAANDSCVGCWSCTRPGRCQ